MNRHPLNVLKERNPSLPILVGITKTDVSSEAQIQQCKQAINNAGFELPFVACDAREHKSALMLIDILMSEIETLELLAQL